MAGIGWAPLGGEWWTWQWCLRGGMVDVAMVRVLNCGLERHQNGLRARPTLPCTNHLPSQAPTRSCSASWRSLPQQST